MMSALRGTGGWPKCDNSTDRLRDWGSENGGGVKNSKIWRMSHMDDPLGRREGRGRRHFEHHVCSAWDLSSFHTLSRGRGD